MKSFLSGLLIGLLTIAAVAFAQVPSDCPKDLAATATWGANLKQQRDLYERHIAVLQTRLSELEQTLKTLTEKKIEDGK